MGRVIGTPAKKQGESKPESQLNENTLRTENPVHSRGSGLTGTQTLKGLTHIVSTPIHIDSFKCVVKMRSNPSHHGMFLAPIPAFLFNQPGDCSDRHIVYPVIVDSLPRPVCRFKKIGRSKIDSTTAFSDGPNAYIRGPNRYFRRKRVGPSAVDCHSGLSSSASPV